MHTMQRRALACALGMSTIAATVTSHADQAQVHEIAKIRDEMAALKTHYDTQIATLEARLAHAERALAEAAATPPVPPAASPPANAPSNANALNPAVSLVLIGNYAAHSEDPERYSLPGFATSSDAHPLTRGFSLGESELTVAANIDDKFYGSLTAALSIDDGDTRLDLEEAYFQTLALPFGMTLKGGRFFSRIGYLNEQHPHADDFVDRPLPYLAFLNGTYGDDGLQFRWLAPTLIFFEIGAEAYRGDSFPAHGAADHGVGAYTAFVHVGDDLGDSWSYRLGGSYLHTEAEARATGTTPDVFSGTDELLVADAILKWAPDGNPVQRNFKLQTEVMRRREEGLFNHGDYAGTQYGFYAQAVYQFVQRWRTGLRFDALYPDNGGRAVPGTVLDDQGHDPSRLAWLLEFDNSEFSRLRLQYVYDESGLHPDHQLMVNYIYSLGAHGAHQF